MVRGDRGIPSNAAMRIRETAAALDPRLRVDDLQTLDEVYRLSFIGKYLMGVALAALALCVVLFSVTGIYTLMSFSVEARRREIGIRSALGASATRLALGAFRRVLIPVGASAVIGAIGAIAIDSFLASVLFDAGPEKRLHWLLPAGELFILLIAVIVVIGPVRRVLRVDPVQALRDG
jgi:putative ABC transport system permease protein